MSTASEQIRGLFHFTDSRNIASIIKKGGLYCTADLRKMRSVVFHPGGNDQSLESDLRFGMDQYVHLCLISEHPMEFLATNDGRIEKTAWLQVDLAVLKFEGVLYCPGVSNKSGMTAIPLDEAGECIDHEVLYQRTKWSDPEIKERRKIAKKCEILVPRHIPMKYLKVIR